MHGTRELRSQAQSVEMGVMFKLEVSWEGSAGLEALSMDF